MYIYNSTHQFHNRKDYSPHSEKIEKLQVIKNEEFGFFVSFDIPEKTYVCLGRHEDLPWWGLQNRCRFETLIHTSSQSLILENKLCAYVRDDDGTLYADMLSNEPALYYEPGRVPVYVGGKVLAESEDRHIDLEFRLYRNEGYQKEILIDTRSFSIQIMDFSLEKEDEIFFLDLWQHPCSWARAYGLEYFGEAHFALMEHYIAALAKLGQRVITLVVSDFPWAGQKCFAVKENASRLYEYNIVNVFRKSGKLQADFSAFDRYIELCMQYGIREEINLFGICGNWHGSDFSSPLTDYEDPIRIRLYDEDESCFDYIRSKEELQSYLSLLFAHLEEKGYMSISKIVGDEPSNAAHFRQFQHFLSQCHSKIPAFKYALHSKEFLEQYEGSPESFSLNSAFIGTYVQEGQMTGLLREHAKEMSWYPCCFPRTLNTFVSSPSIESRYLGLYTYLWQFKGMLRWAYALYTEEPMKDISYKKESWAAGDMFFVYPGKDMRPVSSIREKNMLFSIQDFNLFHKLEKRGLPVREILREKLNIRILAANRDKDLYLDPYTDYEIYKEIRDELIGSIG